jgi:ATP-binding cassette subfamily B multidrug efflux pump
MRNDPLFAILSRCIRSHKGLTAALLAAIGGSVAFALLPPMILQRAVDHLTVAQSISLLLAVEYFLSLALSALFECVQNEVIAVLGQSVTAEIRLAMAGKLQKLSAPYYASHDAGSIVARFVGDVDTVETLFSDGVVSLFANACQVVGILAAVYLRSVGLGALLTVVLPGLFFLTRHFQKRMLAAQSANRAALEKLNSYLPETLRVRRLIRTFSLHHYMEARYDRALGQSYGATERSNLYDSIYSPIIVIISTCLTAVLMIFAAAGGGAGAIFGMSVGAAVASIAYIGKIFSPLENIGMEIQNIQSAMAGLRRIRSFLSSPERDTPCGDVPQEATLSVRDVTFGYAPEAPVLQNLSFTVHAGETATLLGRTGCGKSTVFCLLLGLYPPQSGSVTVGGVDACTIPDLHKRRLFGYVPQDFQAVRGTVGEQISLFDKAITPRQIESAATLVGLHEILSALPQGYDTPMAQLTLSHGQYQLLSIARAVVTDPPILLLDEITAGLDTDTEARVLAALKRVSQGRTVLSISHRLSAISGTQIQW